MADDGRSIAEAVGSVTDGVSVWCPSNSSRKRKRAGQDEVVNTFQEHNGFHPLYAGREPTSLCGLRFQKFNEHWNAIEGHVNDIFTRLNMQANDRIVQFVEKAYSPVPDVGAGCIKIPYREVPTGLVFAGINIPDYELLFVQVAERLSQTTPHRVAMLPSQKCLTLKATVKLLIEQLIGTAFAEDDGYEESSVPIERPSTARLPAYDMQMLATWRARSNLQGNLVAIIPDFECFEPEVLQDLIAMCSEYQDTLPFVLLFGMATSMHALHHTLSRASLNLLRTEKFKLHHSSESINAIVDELIVKPNAFGIKLAWEPYELLLNTYQLHTLSVGSFVRSLKYVLMDLYFSNPLSVLLGSDPSTPQFQGVLDTLTEDHLTEIRMMRSFKVHVERLVETDPDRVAALLLHDPSLKQWIVESMQELQEYHIRYGAALSCLEALQDAVKSPSFKRPQRTLHLLGLREEVADSEKCLTTDIKSFLEAWLKILAGTNLCQDECTTIDGLLAGIDDFVDSDSDSDDQRRGRVVAPVVRSKRRTNTSRRTAVVELVDKGSWEEVMKKISDFFRCFLRKAMKRYADLPLHELQYFANASRVRKAFHPQPRAAVQTALGQTRHYLKCDCCVQTSNTDGVILHTQNDISIAYKLYLECGRMINLYDWFVAFGAVVEKEREDVVDKTQIQARFVRAIAELQFLGFIKGTKRKTDHVLRLVWGSV
ncbi:Origin recognition complex subunit 3 [Gaertneriomyces sp. JEL0708]|nr:Origin recognition complex subunit 3 [Gaertneriomyces sp. JEL0708]